MEVITNYQNTRLIKKYVKHVMKSNSKDGYPFSKRLLTVEI